MPTASYDDRVDVEVSDNPDASRWEARIGGELAGVADYLLAGDAVAFTHTEVDDRFAGHGVGGALARTALDAARASGLRVVAQCPFIAGWIEHHPDYADLL
jgi:uncharacterized protein